MIKLKSIGVDTGYGDCKVAACDPIGNVVTRNFPSLVAKRLKQFPTKDQYAPKVWQAKVSDGWLAAGPGIRSYRDAARVVDDEYARTQEYKVLTKIAACLVAHDLDATEVENLVIGLPVNQFKDTSLKDSLVHLLQGPFRVFYGEEEVSLNVKKVMVMPQPAGAFWYHVLQLPEEQAVATDTLVIDFGNGTTDCAIAERPLMVMARSRSIQTGVHDMKKAVAIELGGQGFYSIMTDDITSVLEGKKTIVSNKELIRERVVALMAKPMRDLAKIIRQDTEAPKNSEILLTGAIAKSMKPFIEKEFPGFNILCVSDDGVFDNARGFELAGRG
jgi:PRTRC genetic system protein D